VAISLLLVGLLLSLLYKFIDNKTAKTTEKRRLYYYYYYYYYYFIIIIIIIIIINDRPEVEMVSAVMGAYPTTRLM